jgi:hypothetical protein
LYRTRVQGASGLFTNCRELKKLTITGKYDDEIQAGNWHKDELNEYSKHCLYSVPTPGSFPQDRRFLGSINVAGIFEGTKIEEIRAIEIAIDYIPKEWKKLAITGFMRAAAGDAPIMENIAEGYLEVIKKMRGLTAYANDSAVMSYLISNGIIKADKVAKYLEIAQQNNNLEVTAMLLELKNSSKTTKCVEKLQLSDRKPKETKKEKSADFSEPNFIKKMFPMKDGGFECKNAVTRFKGDTETVFFPAEVDGVKVDGIGDCGGSTPKNYLKIKKVVLPEGYRYIGARAFKGCVSLETVIIPEGVRTISEEAFCGCIALKTVVLPMSLTSVGKWSFRDSGVKEIYVLNPQMRFEGTNWLRGCSQYTIFAPEGSSILEKKNTAVLERIPDLSGD